MKNLITSFASLLLFVFVSFGQNQQQEVLIIGSMHTVPKIVKNSYKPMLKFAKNYKPQAIYVESPMANDSLSWNYLKDGWSKSYQNFYHLLDSLQQNFDFDEAKFNTIRHKHFVDMSTNDLEYLINSFAYKRDNGNYGFYKYIKQYGANGAKKPTRHEDGDLTYKLALFMGHKKVINMDDQRTNGLYHKAWSKCAKEGAKNGSNIANSKLYKKNYNSSILPAVLGNLGKHTNKKTALKELHTMASFEYAVEKTEGCSEGTKYWNERNMRMSKNIATQVLASNNKRNVVIVGASHVIGLEKELKENYPNLKVILMND